MKEKQKEKLAEASAALEAHQSEVNEAWTALKAAKAKAQEAGADLLAKDSEVRAELEATGEAYDLKCDEHERMKADFDKVAALLGAEAPKPARLPGQASVQPVDQRDARSAWDTNLDSFMAGVKEWGEQAFGPQGLGVFAENGVRAVGASPSFPLISRDDFRRAIRATTMSMSDYPSLDTRRPGIVPLIKETLSVLDVIPMVPVSSDTVEYVYEKTFTHSTAVETAEGSAAGEGVLDYDVAEVSCKRIPFTIPATKQLLADEPRMRAFIEDHLVYGVRDRLMNEIIGGDGTGQNLTGIENWSGILTQDTGTNSVTDVILKGKTKIRVQTKGMYEPNVLFMHPNDEERLLLAKDSQNNYLFRGPESEMLTVWGLRPLSHVAFTEGSPIIADIRACECYVRSDVTLSVTDSHDDHFTKEIVDFLASGRFGFAVLAAKAFLQVTDFDS